MNIELEKRTRNAGIVMGISLLVFTLLGCALAVMIRKEQGLTKQIAAHRTVAANLPLMAEDARQMRQQVANFRQFVPSANANRSTDLILVSRLDQVKDAFPSYQMGIVPLEKKDTVATTGFSFNFPLQSFTAVINTLGKLQTETFPFVVITNATLDSSATGSFAVNGSIIMPLAVAGVH